MASDTLTIPAPETGSAIFTNASLEKGIKTCSEKRYEKA